MLHVHITKKRAHFTLQADFTADNEILMLLGPSGSGKTTILECIAGLVIPDSGLIRLNDQTMYSSDATFILSVQQRKIGYVFQDDTLFPHMTVEKNILYGIRSQKQEPDQLFLDQVSETLGIRHLWGSYPWQISGGEKQRVSLARALATKPNLLLLDEPLSALDSTTRAQCQDELLRLHQLWHIPFIMVTHDEEEARKLGSTIIRLEQGQIVHN
ncbi:ATP-binding cassette domain-containing protein [Brevibacillus daliensis]|uniref:ATP-binding cassette domain-containing protein n=1 Tax=Brevibacillus daliensis TaxID=2892995 RepID=UPI001E5E74CF|nr:ATP-binding cassette domain-containing protein [Brevibacillus daliensis]